ncbi:unnamed protein product [Candida verbasci]|uniref:Uncharacterized protein n=1 Tax=Candida verbasci TaxID=1227364 RepID=A0A9W4TW92_9ASCO|nr:unnamed protein product [Candida verbasci]
MGKPKYIFIIRHGESEGNCDKSVNRYVPNHLVPLTENGHQQSLKAGQVLADFLLQQKLPSQHQKNKRSICFYTSPYLRTRQTCHNIVEGIKQVPEVEYQIKEEPRMREQDFGNFQSSQEEMEKIWEERARYGHFFYRIANGEAASDVYDRVAGFNETLFRQFKDENFPNILVLVTHGVWSRVFLMKWFKWTYEEFESLQNVPHCEYIIMKKNDKTQKYHLKTKLKTWDDLEDDKEIDNEIIKEVNEETGEEYEVEDEEIQLIIQAQKQSIEDLKLKNKKIHQLYKTIHNNPDKNNKSNNNNNNNNDNNDSIETDKDKLVSRFRIDNQSVVNSVESFHAHYEQLKRESEHYHEHQHHEINK